MNLTNRSYTTTAPLAQRTEQLAFALFRTFVGLDFFGHGYARIFTGSFLPGFAQSMQTSMATAPLAPTLVLYVGYVIPVVELLVGLLLVLGIFTRAALTLAFGLMFVLIFGVTMKQDWTAASQQMIYTLALFTLLFLRDRFDAGWLAVLRPSSAPAGPVAVPMSVRPAVQPDSSPLGRS